MNRREVLAAATGVGVLGGGAYYGAGWGRSGGESRFEPVELETIDAPGSDAGKTTIPREGTPTLVEFFATTCAVCSRYMPALVAVHERLEPDVAFVSVTNEPIGVSIEIEDVRTWWADHDGDWTVALDPDLALTDELDVSALPTSVLVDADGVVRWHERGDKSEGELLDAIETAVDVRS